LNATSRAVFISYASQDAEAAGRICEALRAAGVEVWFDQSELRGGDAWDQSIRKQIKTCALFLPIISRNTHDRIEGYFRLEWKLAVDRSHLMAADQAFLLPVVIDDTRDDGERVPERFREVQWTRLPSGVTPAAFIERVRRLLAGELSEEPSRTASSAARVSVAPTTGKLVFASWRSKAAMLAMIAAVVVLGYLLANRLVLSQRGAEVGAAPVSATQSAPATAFNPPPHSIAVLPFVNLSGDKEQEYFSDGLTEELLNSLSRISGLQVAARTSAFAFKGKDVDIGTIARRLNVGAVLEGSVRRSANTIRITAQLNHAVTGFHLWSQTYDRDLGDVLKLQTEIADAVTSTLKVTLLGGAAPKVELGATHNPTAFDAYLRGLKLARTATSAQQCRAPIDAFTEAIELDSSYALAYANRALTILDCAFHYTPDWLTQQAVPGKARADAERAIALAPELAEGHVALSSLQAGLLEFAAAEASCARALTVAPSNDRALYYCSRLTGELGHADAAISGARHGVALDPLNPLSHRALGDTLRYARRYDEAIAAYQDSIAVDPEHSAEAYARRGLSYYLAGNLAQARSSCEARPDYHESWECQAMTYHKTGRHEDATAALARLVQLGGDGAAYQYAEIRTQWGERGAGLEWLEKAMRLRDPGLIYLKTDPLLDPLRNEPRFQAIERALKFPPQ
jgi:TolB-like protein